MNAARDEFLSGSALASDQNRCIVLRHLFCKIEGPSHLSAFSNHAAEPLPLLNGAYPFFQSNILALQLLAFPGFFQRQKHLVDLERFGDIIVSALFHGFDSRIHRTIGGHHDHRGFGQTLPSLP